jgi:DNA polymerase III subunit delta'
MNSTKEIADDLNPINQLTLFGYKHYFNSFVKLHNKHKLPQTIMLSAPKGYGKATFAYHFINYILSLNEEKKYSLENFTIDPNNKSYNLIINNIHPNFFLLDNSTLSENIKVDEVRRLLIFLSKSSYSGNKKIVLIDNSEYLNLNSSNALLKALEEAPENTFFFIIHNSKSKILNTIISRSIKFNFSFSPSQKKNILRKIIDYSNLNLEFDALTDVFFLDSVGNLLRYLFLLDKTDFDLSKDKLKCVYYLIDKYQTTKDSNLLSLASFFIEQYYSELSLTDSSNINTYIFKKNKILNTMNDTKNFNLDKKNLMIVLNQLI